MWELLLSEDMVSIAMWIGIWGIADTVINKYINPNDHNKRIMLYTLIIIIGIILYQSRKQLLSNV